MSTIIKTGRQYSPIQKFVMVVELPDGVLSQEEVKIIHKTSDWRFKFAFWFPGSTVHKAVFERFGAREVLA